MKKQTTDDRRRTTDEAVVETVRTGGTVYLDKDGNPASPEGLRRDKQSKEKIEKGKEEKTNNE